ncbi:hypothetical protein AAMO2058_001315500 [Amorphochlora amoebiformis]
MSTSSTSGANDIVFLSSFSEIWTFVTIWAVTVVGIVYFIMFCRVPYVDIFKLKGLWIPWVAMTWGIIVGFIHGAPIAAVIAGLYTTIPYAIGSDVATSIGIAEAIVIIYFHWGRGLFVHHITFTGFRSPSLFWYRNPRDQALRGVAKEENPVMGHLERNIPTFLLSSPKISPKSANIGLQRNAARRNIAISISNSTTPSHSKPQTPIVIRSLAADSKEEARAAPPRSRSKGRSSSRPRWRRRSSSKPRWKRTPAPLSRGASAVNNSNGGAEK